MGVIDTPSGVRVATWNLLHGLDVRTGRIDLGAAAAAVHEMAVDVLAVQEVDRGLRRSGGRDQVADLARRLGWHGVFAPALLGDPERQWQPGPGEGTDPGGPAYGVGLLSRWPLHGVVRRALPGGGAGRRRPEDVGRLLPGWDREPRVALRARVRTDTGHELTVGSTHLSFQVWRSVRQLVAAIGLVGAGGGPAVLLGDFNLPWRLLRPATTGRAWASAHAGPTYPAWRPGMQLDHVMGRAVRIREVLAGPRGPSDHLPLRATVVQA